MTEEEGQEQASSEEEFSRQPYYGPWARFRLDEDGTASTQYGTGVWRVRSDGVLVETTEAHPKKTWWGLRVMVLDKSCSATKLDGFYNDGSGGGYTTIKVDRIGANPNPPLPSGEKISGRFYGLVEGTFQPIGES